MRALVPAFKCRVACVGLAVVAATLGIVGSAPIGADAAARPAAAVKRLVSAHTAHAFLMPAPGIATVQSIKLPAGAWSVIGEATAVDESSSDFVRCALTDQTHGTQLDASTAFVGSAGTHAGNLTNLATIVVPAGATVRVVQGCGHDGAAGDAASLDVGASVVAFQTLDGTAAGQAIARTTANTALTQSEAPVLTLPLDPGSTYAVALKLTGVTFSGEAQVHCVLRAAGNYLADVTTSIGSATAAATNAHFGYVTGLDSLDVSCREIGDAGAYLDPDVLLWARKVKAVTAVEEGCGARLVNGTTDLVALVRTASGCSIPGGSETQLSSALIAKGTWVVVGAESSIASSDGVSGYLRCFLDGGGADIGDSRAWDAQAQYFGVTTLGTMKLAHADYVSVNCARDGEGTEATTTYGGLVMLRV